MKLSREHAMELSAWCEICKMTEVERVNILTDIFSENDGFETINDFSNEKYNMHILKYLKESYANIKNSYMEEILKDVYLIDIKIIGEVTLFFPCNCCKYLTIKNKGNYNICPVCFWEDDGTEELEKYSYANNMTLIEAIKNYKEYNAINIKFKNKVEDGSNKYVLLTT